MIIELKVKQEITLKGIPNTYLIAEAIDGQPGKMSLQTNYTVIGIPGIVLSYVIAGGSFDSYIKDTGNILSYMPKEDCDIMTVEIRKLYDKMRKLIKDAK